MFTIGVAGATLVGDRSFRTHEASTRGGLSTSPFNRSPGSRDTRPSTSPGSPGKVSWKVAAGRSSIPDLDRRSSMKEDYDRRNSATVRASKHLSKWWDDDTDRGTSDDGKDTGKDTRNTRNTEVKNARMLGKSGKFKFTAQRSPSSRETRVEKGSVKGIGGIAGIRI